MRHAVHGEGVEPDFFFHDRNALRTPRSPPRYPPGLNAGLSTEIVAFRGVLARQIRKGDSRVGGPIPPVRLMENARGPCEKDSYYVEKIHSEVLSCEIMPCRASSWRFRIGAWRRPISCLSLIHISEPTRLG